MPGYVDNKEAIQQRLRRIEGQVRGVQRMVDEDAYCIDVLDADLRGHQGAAGGRARAARRAPRRTASPMRWPKGGNEADDKVAEASAAIARLVRS